MSAARVIWHLMRFRPGVYTLDTFFWVVITNLELVYGLLTKAFFDTLTGDAPVSLTITGMAVLVIVAGVVHLIMVELGVYVDAHQRMTIASLIRRNLLQNVLEHPGAKALAVPAGEAVSTFRDDGMELEDAVNWFIDFVSELVFGVIALVIMVSISPRITLLTVLPLAAVLLISQTANKRLKRYRQESRKATEKVTGNLGEVLSAVQAIQIAGAEGHILQHFAKLNKRRQVTSVRDSLLRQIIESFLSNSGALAMGLTLVVAASAMQQGDFTIGDFALFVAYLQLLAVFTTFMGTHLAQWKQSVVSFDRMWEMLRAIDPETPAEKVLEHRPVYYRNEAPPIEAPRPTRADRLRELRISGLNYRFSETSDVGLKEISFTIPGGSFTVITGRIGSGKTTLLRSILGLLPVQTGQLFWNDQLINDPANFFVPPRSAYTPQQPRLLSASLRDNLLLGLPETTAILDKAIYQAVMERDLAGMSDGYDTMLGPKGVRLSGGQIQRTAAARTFLRQPELYVFDDLSSALDVNTERLLWERLFTLTEGVQRPTCLVVSHRRPALQRADQIILLHEGEIADMGKLQDLLERSQEMRHLWANQ